MKLSSRKLGPSPTLQSKRLPFLEQMMRSVSSVLIAYLYLAQSDENSSKFTLGQENFKETVCICLKQRCDQTHDAFD